MKLGVETDALDATGRALVRDVPFTHVTREGLERVVAAQFVGNIMQVPPMCVRGVLAFRVPARR